MDYEAILKSFGDKVYRSGSEEYIQLDSCVDFVNMLCENKLAVIGVELFEISNGKVRPRMDWIGDWSEGINYENDTIFQECRDWTLQFLAKCPTGPFFFGNFTVLSEEEMRLRRQSKK